MKHDIEKLEVFSTCTLPYFVDDADGIEMETQDGRTLKWQVMNILAEARREIDELVTRTKKTEELNNKNSK